METNNKLREALEELMKFTCNSCERRLCEDDAEEEDGHIVSSPCSAIIRARNALAEPVKNCEVGTAMEQSKRFSAYCQAHKHPAIECLNCPLVLQTGGHCELAWAQLPYTEGATK